MNLDTSDQNKPKATFDPGWNDPPTFSYDATKITAQPGKRGTLLNKRVAFPMSPSTGGCTSTQSPSGVSEQPPLRPPIGPPCNAPSGAPPPVLTGVPASLLNSDSCDSEEALQKGVDILCQIVDTLPPDDKRQKDDIKKRLDVLRKMCKEDKLNPDIYGRLVQLASALQNGDTAAACNIQAGLMVDHVGLCSSWMAGVRLLVRRKADPDS
ncbi:Uncharacterized protein GBIM_11383 [Gryllus bimaculatus]|nr:Uncharacterized protein GBIM_11383 [Gryllus bimaculatus]